MEKKLVLGLTGGIASGKSTVLNIFKELGAQTISADILAKDLLCKNEPTYNKVIERFGGRIVNSDGEIDRLVLGDIVFNDADAIKDLNNIIHPQVIESIKKSIDKFRKEGSGIFVAEIPLLYECALESIVDKVIVVSAEQETQINRLKKRFGFTRTQAESRIKSQFTIEEKSSRADFVIRNDGTKDELYTFMLQFWRSMYLLCL